MKYGVENRFLDAVHVHDMMHTNLFKLCVQATVMSATLLLGHAT